MERFRQAEYTRESTPAHRRLDSATSPPLLNVVVPPGLDQTKIDFIANLLYNLGETLWGSWRSALERLEPPVLRLVVWLGNSRANLLDFPREVRKLMGDELQLMQYGGIPQNAKPYRGLGSGVFEIALSYETNAYRAVVAVQIGKKIYVLHVFQKKSKSGIKTPQSDKDLIRKRYNAAVSAAREEDKNERRN